jgi:NAD(P)-dependent dehydrogenase (short-subunit alcohol dehydrogenase family)
VDLCGTVALVTGSSRGLAEQAARVAVHDRAGHEAAQETLGLLVGGQHAVFGADLSDAGTARGLLEDDVAREMGRMDVLGIGRIDKLVNNAGISESPVPEVDYEGWQDAWSRTIATNFTGLAKLSFLVARIMMESGGGRVVSVWSRRCSPWRSSAR